MDLLQTVRKEGSRGGVNFSWDDVKSSAHRENYLGHSLMAPVGRWQAKKDLGWYAKANDAELTPEEREEKERLARKEELKKVKEAEEDAMLRAMGLPVPDRSHANLEPLGMSKDKQGEVNKALKEALGDDEHEERAGLKSSRSKDDRRRRDRSRDRRRDCDDEDRSSKRRRRSRARSRSRDRERRHRHNHHDRARSGSRERRRRRSEGREQRRDDRYRPRDTRSRSRDRDRRRHRSRSRSRSPRQSRRYRDDR